MKTDNTLFLNKPPKPYPYKREKAFRILKIKSDKELYCMVLTLFILYVKYKYERALFFMG